MTQLDLRQPAAAWSVSYPTPTADTPRARTYGGFPGQFQMLVDNTPSLTLAPARRVLLLLPPCKRLDDSARGT